MGQPYHGVDGLGDSVAVLDLSVRLDQGHAGINARQQRLVHGLDHLVPDHGQRFDQIAALQIEGTIQGQIPPS